MEFFKKFLKRLLAVEKSPHKLALGCCLGIGMGLSPFLGVQTWLAIPLSWLIGTNIVVVLAVLYLINNPFTMFPIVIADYATGHWIVDRVFGMDLSCYNPSWMGWVQRKVGPSIEKYLGIQTMSFWTYIIGGMLLAIVCSVAFYYPLFKLFSRTGAIKRYLFSRKNKDSQ